MAAWRIRHQDEEGATASYGLSRATGEAALARDLAALTAAGLIELDPHSDGTWRVSISNDGAALLEDDWNGAIGDAMPAVLGGICGFNPDDVHADDKNGHREGESRFELDDALMHDRPRDTLLPAFDAKPAIDHPDARRSRDGAAAAERTTRDHQTSCDNGPGA